MSNTKKSLGAVSRHPIFLASKPKNLMFSMCGGIALLLFSLTTNNKSLHSIHWEDNITKKKNSIIASDSSTFKCPVKMFVYDLGFTNKTIGLKRGFHADTIRKKNLYTFITSVMGPLSDHPLFILHKFISSGQKHSHCTVNEAKDADFLILPLYDQNPSETDRVVHMLEHSEFNDTLFRRGQKDHILLNFHNTKKGWLMTLRLKNRTKELITPMIKVLADVFDWGFHFEHRKRTDLAEINFDRMMTVPFSSHISEYSGDIHEQRPYLVSFMGNGIYPLYRKKIVQQCHAAMIDPARGDCLLAETNRSKPSIGFDSMYANSTFFFSPGGDTGPRKALFDGIALNSIPVIFEETSLDVTYPAYFPGNPRDYSVFLNSSSDDIMGQLRNISSSRILELQNNIARVRDSVAYLPDANAYDATWVMMKQLEQYKLNGYKFIDRFPNKTTLYCVDKDEEFHGQCRFLK